MNKNAKLLVYAGLIPFVGLPLLLALGELRAFQGILYFSQYSAGILSFFGGVHWFDALQNNRHTHQLYVAMLPSIIAWLSLAFLPPTMTITLLALCYVLILAYDLRVLNMPQGYDKLRVKLTVVVVLCHGIIYFQYP